MSRIRLAVAGAALAAAFAPFAPAASADPATPVWPPGPTHIGQCTLWWRPVYVFSDDVPVTPYVPYCVW